MVSTVVKEAAFSFTSVTSDDILKEIKRLGIKKATQEIDIPTKIKTQFPVLIKILTAAELKVLFVMILKRQWNIKLKKKDCKIELSSYKLYLSYHVLPYLSKMHSKIFYRTPACSCVWIT